MECTVETLNASNLYRELRETAPQRTDRAAEMVNEFSEGWIVWCNTNLEADLLKRKIPDAVDVRGSMSISQKENAINAFSNGDTRVMLTKPSMCGHGLNWQHCHNMAFVGLSYSFEQRYQAIRRCWRFGQKHPVNDHVILSPAESQVFNIVKQKELRHKEMEDNMVNDVKSYQVLDQKRLELSTDYERKVFSGRDYYLIHGDAVNEIQTIKSDSVHFQIFSPPFSNLYIYSDSVRDMGNCKNDKTFFEQLEYLISELYRILAPGRLCAVHCKDLVDYKTRDGRSGLRDFPGETIRRFEKYGFKYHSRVTIWKDPVIEMQRTKAQGLLHKQVKKDASMSRMGLPDYLIVFRKWPENGETSGPEPVVRPGGFRGYVGENFPVDPVYTLEKNDQGVHELVRIPKGDDIFSIHVWQRYASPVWFDIQQTNVLNFRVARDCQDEKHICPLQMDVIKKAIHLWTNPGDVVFTPFAGIGSEMVGAVELGRKASGIELKGSYVEYSVKYLEEIENKEQQLELFN